MGAVMQITSMQNPRIKEAYKLWKRRDRDESGRFLIEGFRELTRACDAHIEVEELFICEALFLGSNEPSLIAALKAKGALVFSCSEAVFRKLSYRDRPDGLIAVAKKFHTTLDQLKSKSGVPFYVVAEGIEKPGNLGTILRSADATGVDGVIVSDRQTDVHNPNVVRASVGTLFTVPVVEAESEKAFQWLKEQGIMILSATPHAAVEYTEVDMRKPLAIVVGAEQYGLSDLWMKKGDIQVRIPLLGVADSLNVATATTLLLYEVIRQRRGNHA